MIKVLGLVSSAVKSTVTRKTFDVAIPENLAMKPVMCNGYSFYNDLHSSSSPLTSCY